MCQATIIADLRAEFPDFNVTERPKAGSSIYALGFAVGETRYALATRESQPSASFYRYARWAIKEAAARHEQ